MEFETIRALDDISLQIYPGDFVGIMGRNGAGKTTLLKVLSGVLPPTSGKISADERVAPLFGFGVGFQPELTGHENIFLYGSLLGISRRDVRLRLDSIIEFSELSSRIQRPVRSYSSGMVRRLAFSVVSHLDTRILALDEVLVAGDSGFQEKCVGFLNKLRQEGRTVILVTHSTEEVQSFCNRCILLSDQHKVFDGDPGRGALLYKQLNTHDPMNARSGQALSYRGDVDRGESNASA